MAEFTKCWDCAKATTNECSWSDRLEPVDGWTAIPTLKSQFRMDPFQSFLVIDCPEFKRDAWNGGAMRPEEYEKREGRNKAKNRDHHQARG